MCCSKCAPCSWWIIQLEIGFEISYLAAFTRPVALNGAEPDKCGDRFRVYQFENSQFTRSMQWTSACWNVAVLEEKLLIFFISTQLSKLIHLYMVPRHISYTSGTNNENLQLRHQCLLITSLVDQCVLFRRGWDISKKFLVVKEIYLNILHFWIYFIVAKNTVST